MVLVQILMTSENPTTFTLPVSGVCDIKVLGAQAHYTDANTRSRVIEFQSDALYLPFSPQKYPCILTNGVGTVTFDSSIEGYHIIDARINGQITVAPITKINAGSGTTGVFTGAILTLDIHKKADF